MNEMVYLVGGHNGRQISMPWLYWWNATGTGLPYEIISAAWDRTTYPASLGADTVREFAERLREKLDSLPREDALGEFLGPVVQAETADGRYTNYFLTEKASWIEIDDCDMIFFDLPDVEYEGDGLGLGREIYEEIIGLLSNGSHVNVYLEDIQRKALTEHLKAQGLPDKPIFFGSLSKEHKQQGIWLLQSMLHSPEASMHERKVHSRKDIIADLWDMDIAELAIIGMQTDLNIALKEAEQQARGQVTQ